MDSWIEWEQHVSHCSQSWEECWDWPTQSIDLSINISLFAQLHKIGHLYRAPTSNVGCVDSPFKLRWKNTDLYGFCTDGRITQKLCDANLALRSHCPLSCNMCTAYTCEDSQAAFMYRPNKVASCAALDAFSPERKNEVCEIKNVSETCRSSCRYCH